MSAVNYVVPPMSCDHCKAAVMEAVGQVGGVTAIDVDLDTKVVTVSGDEVSESAVRAAMRRAGYDAE